jgi:uncharacterized protein YndB with AHSA1/START domain
VTIDPRLAPVRQSVEVQCGIEDAFDLFTARMAEWWPLDVASYGGDRASAIFLEPRVGGRFFERFLDGDELQVGTVIACDPPRRILFTWKTTDWQAETHVEVTFSRSGGGTRIDLEHRGFDDLGPMGPDVADKFRGGWPGVMNSFTAIAQSRDGR